MAKYNGVNKFQDGNGKFQYGKPEDMVTGVLTIFIAKLSTRPLGPSSTTPRKLKFTVIDYTERAKFKELSPSPITRKASLFFEPIIRTPSRYFSASVVTIPQADIFRLII